jgi:hypothetical protein
VAKAAEIASEKGILDTTLHAGHRTFAPGGTLVFSGPDQPQFGQVNLVSVFIGFVPRQKALSIGCDKSTIADRFAGKKALGPITDSAALSII